MHAWNKRALPFTVATLSSVFKFHKNAAQVVEQVIQGFRAHASDSFPPLPSSSASMPTKSLKQAAARRVTVRMFLVGVVCIR